MPSFDDYTATSTIASMTVPEGTFKTMPDGSQVITKWPTVPIGKTPVPITDSEGKMIGFGIVTDNPHSVFIGQQVVISGVPLKIISISNDGQTVGLKIMTSVSMKEDSLAPTLTMTAKAFTEIVKENHKVSGMSDEQFQAWYDGMESVLKKDGQE